jgi:hypothetical protein
MPKKPRADLGQLDYQERYRVGARVSRRRGETLQGVWDEIRKGDEFSVPQLAKRTGVSKNYVKIYVRALRIAGYLVVTKSNDYGNPHNPARYRIGHYREKLAPQLAGGSGKTGSLGRAWKTIHNAKED